MPTPTEISKDWKTGRPYVCKCIKKGCPTDSFESARLWRQAHTTQRATTSPAQIAKQLAEENNDASPAACTRSRKHFKENVNGTSSRSDDRFADALASAIEAQKEAWRLLKESMAEGKDSKIGVRLAVHNKAVEALFKAAKEHREELERTRILIPLSEAMDLTRRGYDIILSRLRLLPPNAALRCNPTNPHHAMAILETECTEIIAEARRVYAVDAV
jgi:hypothetical protein